MHSMASGKQQCRQTHCEELASTKTNAGQEDEQFDGSSSELLGVGQRVLRLGLVLDGTDALGGVTTWAYDLAAHCPPGLRFVAIVLNSRCNGSHDETLRTDHFHDFIEWQDTDPAALMAHPQSVAPECSLHAAADALAGRVDVLVPNHLEFGYKVAALCAMRGRPIPTLCMCHTDEPYYYHLAMKYADLSTWRIATSRICQARLRDLGLWADYLAYGAPTHDQLAHAGDRRAGLTIAFVSRLVERQKRVSRLPQLARLLAAARVNVEILVVGDGDRAAWLRGELAAAGLPHRLLGRLPRDEVLQVLRRSDLQLLVSDTEGTPLSMLEAMACGCVPLVPAIAGILDVVVHEDNGYVYPVGDMHAAARTISQISAQRDRVMQVGLRARQSIHARFGIGRHMEELLRLLRETCKDPLPSQAQARRALLDRRLMQWSDRDSIFDDQSPILGALQHHPP